MRRFHVHLAVADLTSSIEFYSALFGARPNVVKTDYAKWMLEDPKINFAISSRSQATGVSHLGLQTDTANELKELTQSVKQAAVIQISPPEESQCCYAHSDKTWAHDPQGLAWEFFYTHESLEDFGVDTAVAPTAASCCNPMSLNTDSPAISPIKRCC